MMATMSLAMQGNATALREVWERLDGKVPQPVADVAAERQQHAELAARRQQAGESGREKLLRMLAQISERKQALGAVSADH